MELHNNLELSNTLSYYAQKNMWCLLILLKMTGFIYLIKTQYILVASTVSSCPPCATPLAWPHPA